MDARPRLYEVAASDARIIDILDSSAAFEEGAIPSSTALTDQNGYYVECTAIFIDIRDSTKLREKHAQRRTLGKLYRAYVSESVAVLNGNPRCNQVFIQGDCVSAVFDTPTKQAVNEVFRLVAALNSVVRLLNYRLQRRGLTPIKVGIGIDTGRALMIRAGFTGSGISDIVWMGDVLNHASHLCHMANKEDRKVIMVSAGVHALLDQPALNLDGKAFVDS
jgi:class 3 adenylate cyclase